MRFVSQHRYQKYHICSCGIKLDWVLFSLQSDSIKFWPFWYPDSLNGNFTSSAVQINYCKNMFEVNHPCDSFNPKMNVLGSLNNRKSFIRQFITCGRHVGCERRDCRNICSTLRLEALALPETPQTHVSCTKYLHAPYVRHTHTHTHTLMPNFNYSCLYFSTVSH